MEIKIGNCEKCGEQLCIGGMQKPYCIKCEPEKDPSCPSHILKIQMT